MLNWHTLKIHNQGPAPRSKAAEANAADAADPSLTKALKKFKARKGLAQHCQERNGMKASTTRP